MTDQIEEIHTASLKILSRTGIHFNLPAAISYFKQAGARIEEDRVYLEPDMVEHALKSAPDQYTLHAPQSSQYGHPRGQSMCGDAHWGIGLCTRPGWGASARNIG